MFGSSIILRLGWVINLPLRSGFGHVWIGLFSLLRGLGERLSFFNGVAEQDAYGLGVLQTFHWQCVNW